MNALRRAGVVQTTRVPWLGRHNRPASCLIGQANRGTTRVVQVLLDAPGGVHPSRVIGVGERDPTEAIHVSAAADRVAGIAPRGVQRQSFFSSVDAVYAGRSDSRHFGDG